MRIGTRVLLVGTEPCMPPLAAEGMIVGPVDEDGDHEVLFPNYPCPNGPEITWFVPWQWLMPIDDSFANKIEAGRIALFRPSLLQGQ